MPRSTPEVVAAMTRLVDETLRGPLFSRSTGLASSDVTLADPAMGTGTFLLAESGVLDGRREHLEVASPPDHLLRGRGDGDLAAQAVHGLLDLREEELRREGGGRQHRDRGRDQEDSGPGAPLAEAGREASGREEGVEDAVGERPGG